MLIWSKLAAPVGANLSQIQAFTVALSKKKIGIHLALCVQQRSTRSQWPKCVLHLEIEEDSGLWGKLFTEMLLFQRISWKFKSTVSSTPDVSWVSHSL